MRLGLPAFLTEIEGPTYRSRLEFGVRSGFSVVLVFALWGVLSGAIPKEPIYFWPVYLKVVTNAVAWLGLRYDRHVLATTSANTFTDVVAMTWAIYMTGGALSPLFCVYAIELTVVALLSNVGTTVLIAVIAVAQYTAMVLAVRFGLVPAVPVPATIQSALSDEFLAVHVLFCAFVLGVPTFFTAAILKQLRDKQRVLEDRTRELVDASRERAQFMANVTHELRTPIHGIHGLAELIECGVYGPVADPRQQRALAEIRAGASSMLSLVDDLLELSSTDAGRISYDACDVDVNDLCDRLAATTRGLVGTRDLELVVDVAPRLPGVRTDRAKLTQIVLNLLANAVKFTPEQGRVTFRAHVREDGDAICFVVEDTGRGIPVDELTRIFEPFHQVEGGTAREHGGVGLGLTLVKRLSDVIGARVNVVSELGRGTTFTVTMPTRPRPMHEPEPVSLVAELA